MPKDFFSKFNSLQNLIVGIQSSMKEQKKNMGNEEYAVHALKFLIDNKIFRHDAFRIGLEQGHIRDFASLCAYFDFRPMPADKNLSDNSISLDKKDTSSLL